MHLTGAAIAEAVKNDCKSCQLLKDAIGSFVPFEMVGNIRITVDCALFIYAFAKESRDAMCSIELYTGEGKLLLLRVLPSSCWISDSMAHQAVPLAGPISVQLEVSEQTRAEKI